MYFSLLKIVKESAIPYDMGFTAYCKISKFDCLGSVLFYLA